MPLVRSGDVDKFVILEIMQLMLKCQILDLVELLHLSSTFESTVRAIWLTYVSLLNVTYFEEGIDAPASSETGSRRSSVTSLSLGSASEPDCFDLSEDDLDMSRGSLSSATAISPQVMTSSQPRAKSRPHLPLTLSVLALALMYHRVPVYVSDLLRLALQGKLFYFRVYHILPKDITSLLNQQQKALFRNPTIPILHELGLRVLELARLMQQINSVPLPVLDSRLMLWRIGEELSLPYLFREDLAALFVRFQIDSTFGLVQERFASDPLITAFALTIFYLKVHYNLLDTALKHSEQRRFTASGFPTQYQLVECWRRTFAWLSNPHGYDESGIRADLPFYKDTIIPLKTSKSPEVPPEDIAQLQRALQLDSQSSQYEPTRPPWLSSGPDCEVEITEFWAKHYPISPSHPSGFSEHSEGYRLLLEIGARLCSCRMKRMNAVVERLFENNVGYGVIRAHFAMES